MQAEADGTQRGGSGGRGRLIGPAAVILALALAAFAISLFATLPAKIAATYVAMPVQFNAYSGTIWNGTASMAGGHSVAWRVDPWRSLIALRPQAEAALTGPGTDVKGHLAFGGSRGNGFEINGLSGRLAWAAVAALVPDLPFGCEIGATLADVAVRSAGEERGGGGGARGAGELHGGGRRCCGGGAGARRAARAAGGRRAAGRRGGGAAGGGAGGDRGRERGGDPA